MRLSIARHQRKMLDCEFSGGIEHSRREISRRTGLKFRPFKPGHVTALAAQNHPMGNEKPPLDRVGSRRKKYNPAAMQRCGFQCGLKCISVVMNVIALGPEAPDVKDRPGPHGRRFDSNRQAAAPCRRASVTVVNPQLDSFQPVPSLESLP